MKTRLRDTHRFQLPKDKIFIHKAAEDDWSIRCTALELSCQSMFSSSHSRSWANAVEKAKHHAWGVHRVRL